VQHLFRPGEVLKGPWASSWVDNGDGLMGLLSILGFALELLHLGGEAVGAREEGGHAFAKPFNSLFRYV
jgi:hypothetical protein